MGKHGAISKNKFAGGLLLGAVASGALAVGSLSSAGAANATCASINGVSSGTGCTTTSFGDVAIGIGDINEATADGGFNIAIASGTNATAIAGNGAGIGNLAVASGEDSFAEADFGNLNAAVALGKGSYIESGGPDPATPGSANIAFAAGQLAEAYAIGDLNGAFALGNRAFADSEGIGNLAVAVGNPGPNPGMVDPVLGDVVPSDDQATEAGAFGNFNRAVVFGKGSTAYAVGGTTFNDQDIPGGNNTAITLGSGSNTDAFGHNRFAAALGANRNAINGINNAP